MKVYEINALNYYSEKPEADVDPSIAVEGLVASDERSFRYDDSPFLRVSVGSFEFPALSRSPASTSSTSSAAVSPAAR